jgi:hypothetical protein
LAGRLQMATERVQLLEEERDLLAREVASLLSIN